MIHPDLCSVMMVVDSDDPGAQTDPTSTPETATIPDIPRKKAILQSPGKNKQLSIFVGHTPSPG